MVFLLTCLGDGGGGAEVGQGVGGVLDVLGFEEGAEGEADGAAGVVGADGAVGQGGAVQAGAGEDAEIAFEGVGEGYASGVWEDTPTDRPQFKAKFAKQRAALAKAEEAIGS